MTTIEGPVASKRIEEEGQYKLASKKHIGERDCQSENLLHICFQACCLHAVQCQESVVGDQAAQHP